MKKKNVIFFISIFLINFLMSIGAIYGHLAVNGYRDNETMAYALTTSFINTAIALAIGYVFYRLIKTKGTPIKASEHGRNWTAWLVVISTTALLPKVIMQPNINTVFAWLVPLIVFSAITFILGFVYGKFKVRKDSSIDVVDNPNTTSNNKSVNSGINCSNCGSEITPKDAKFCKHCGTKVEQVITTSTTVKAEAIKPPTIEKKIVDEIQPEKIPSENQEKKTEKTAVYINKKSSRGNNGVRHNTNDALILLSVFAVLLYFVFIGDSNKTKNNNTYYYGTFSFDNGNVYEGQLMKSLRFPNGRPTYKSGYKVKENGSNSNIENVTKTEESERRSNTQVDFTQLRNHLKYNNGKTTEYYEKNGYTWIEADHYKEWKYYAGWSKNGMPSGYGRIIFRGDLVDLDTYEGELLKGHMHGYGIYTHSSDGMYYKGRWKFGNYDGGGYYDRYGELIQQVDTEIDLIQQVQ